MAYKKKRAVKRKKTNIIKEFNKEANILSSFVDLFTFMMKGICFAVVGLFLFFIYKDIASPVAEHFQENYIKEFNK